MTLDCFIYTIQLPKGIDKISSSTKYYTLMVLTVHKRQTVVFQCHTNTVDTAEEVAARPKDAFHAAMKTKE